MIKQSKFVLTIIAHFCIAFLWKPSPSWAWGERGHDLVTQAACNIIAVRHKSEPEFTTPFVKRCQMLGHLANVPDIYWKSLPKAATIGGGAAHYVDMDYIHPVPSLKSIPSQINQAYKATKENCKNIKNKKVCSSTNLESVMTSVGTIPWRIHQLSNLLLEELKSLKSLEIKLARDKDIPSKADIAKIVNEALLYAGLLSHYVGDAAQPLHNSANYDGWLTEQGGLHAYFESKVLATFDFRLNQDALEFALNHNPAKKIIDQAIELKKAHKTGWNPSEWAVFLGVDSYARLKEVIEIDQGQAVEKPSKDYPLRREAKRKKPTEVAHLFRPILVERLGTGADMLAHFWYETWVKAGKPNMEAYESFNYHFTPEFIPIDYVKEGYKFSSNK